MYVCVNIYTYIYTYVHTYAYMHNSSEGLIVYIYVCITYIYIDVLFIRLFTPA